MTNDDRFEPDHIDRDESRDVSPAGRPAAGADPQKREQILDGAKTVFMQKGFDAASMNDITREAGVSKGTIYVYFDNKEDLFAALIERERAKIVASARLALDDAEPVAKALHGYGVTLGLGLTTDYTIQAMRMVIGVIDRMPGLAARFFAATPENGFTILKAYLDRKVADGTLAIDDTAFAAQQFLSLSQAGIFKHRLFGMIPCAPEPPTVEKAVSAAVDMFLGHYQKPKG